MGVKCLVQGHTYRSEKSWYVPGSNPSPVPYPFHHGVGMLTSGLVGQGHRSKVEPLIFFLALKCKFYKVIFFGK